MVLGLKPATDVSGHTAAISITQFLLFSGFLFTLAAAVRLARFNSSENTPSYFLGLPSPAGALFVVSLWLEQYTSSTVMVFTPWLLFGFVAGISAIMISRVKMISLKFEGHGLRKNIFRYVLLLSAVVLLLLFGTNALPMIMILYVALSIFFNFIPERRK
jgi:CDP-diacylglycerol--serine O-phosphatidyltransferase